MTIDEMATGLIASEGQVIGCARARLGTNGIDQRCGRGEAQPLALVDRSPLLTGMSTRCLVNAPGRDIITVHRIYPSITEIMK